MADENSRLCLECGQHLPLTDFRKNNKMRGGYTNRCKPCLLAKDKARWAALSEDVRAATEARYKQGQADYRKRNAEKVRAAKADYYRRTKERSKAHCYAWRRNNPERFRALARGWNAKRYKYVQGGLTAKELADWCQAQKKVCHWCGKACARAYDIDHIIPLSRGGPHEPSNLAIACRPCNRRKNALDPIEWAQIIGKLL